MSTFLRTVTALVGAAMVMAAWSEFVFYNEDVADALNQTISQSATAALLFFGEIILFYAIPALFLIGLMALFGSAGKARALLLGALTGYAIEGAVVPAVYEAVPISYLWTSVAWHGPVTVGLGVFLIPHLLAQMSLLRMLGISCLLGLGWGLWMPWTWASPDQTPLSANAFFFFAIIATALMAVGYALLSIARWPERRLPRGPAFAVLLPALGLFVVQATLAPIAAAGLALILAALVVTLRKLGARHAPALTAKWRNLAALACMPLAASGVYAAQLELGPPLLTDDLIALTFLSGLLIWIWGVWRGARAA